MLNHENFEHVRLIRQHGQGGKGQDPNFQLDLCSRWSSEAKCQ